MSKAKAVGRYKDGLVIGVYIWCQGCKHVHLFPTSLAYYDTFDESRKITKKPIWTFNNDFDKPTFTPSLKEYYTHPETKAEITTCHSIVTNGNIQFCADCEHELKNQTLPLEEIPDDYGLPNYVIRK